MPFSDDFRNRIFNWVRAYSNHRRTDVNIIYRLMFMYGKGEEADKMRENATRQLTDLPPIDHADADFLDACFREFGRVFPREHRLITLCWFKNLRAKVIKIKTGIFISDQERQLAIAEKKFKYVVERAEELITDETSRNKNIKPTYKD